jgi:hypothetical protein
MDTRYGRWLIARWLESALPRGSRVARPGYQDRPWACRAAMRVAINPKHRKIQPPTVFCVTNHTGATTNAINASAPHPFMTFIATSFLPDTIPLRLPSPDGNDESSDNALSSVTGPEIGGVESEHAISSEPSESNAVSTPIAAASGARAVPITPLVREIRRWFARPARSRCDARRPGG